MAERKPYTVFYAERPSGALERGFGWFSSAAEAVKAAQLQLRASTVYFVESSNVPYSELWQKYLKARGY